MNALIEFLSGEVPGGLLLLLLILLIINLSLFFLYKGSKFFSKEVYRRKVIKSSGFFIIFYITIWFVLRPVPLPDSILFLPFQKGQKCNFIISEILEKQIKGKLSGDYRLHNWEWFYETCTDDSIDNFEHRLSVSQRLNVDLIITGKYLKNSKIKLIALIDKKSFEQDFEFNSYQNLSIAILKWINKHYPILNEEEMIDKQISDNQIMKLTEAKLLYLKSEYNKALSLLVDMQPEPVILKSKIYLELGKGDLNNSKKSELEKQQNKFFANIQNLLIPIAQEGKDNATINRILGRVYLYEDRYKEAEIFLKKALTQNPYDARVYNDMYYLHEDRFKDIGFENRFEVLNKAIEIDNGNSDAVYNLANDYFKTGTGSKSGTGTTFALETLNRYMKINSENKKILILLASINLQIKHADEAISIYKKLIAEGNTDSELYYNLGIGYFHKKDYDEAEKTFMKSIEINEYPDSYLYMGAINRIIGDFEKAKYYYRERIKRSKIGEDDYYATEALHGLQWILKKEYEDSLGSEN
jgi:uncharacterized protein